MSGIPTAVQFQFGGITGSVADGFAATVTIPDVLMDVEREQITNDAFFDVRTNMTSLVAEIVDEDGDPNFSTLRMTVGESQGLPPSRGFTRVDPVSVCSSFVVTGDECVVDADCGSGALCQIGAPLDNDFDGIPDSSDNCPTVPNPSQTDSDANGIGDACDGPGDTDGDTIPDGADNCPQVANFAQLDTDGDGIGDACELTLPCSFASCCIVVLPTTSICQTDGDCLEGATCSGTASNVHSFFEVNYQVEFVGRAGGPLDGIADTSTGTVTMVAGQSLAKATSIPTLSQWGIALLVLLLITASFVLLRGRARRQAS